MTFSPDEMKAVAEHVTGSDHILDEIFGLCPVVRDSNGKQIMLNTQKWFNPKLDGTDREQAQACQCIVAAEKIDSGFIPTFHRDERGFLDERMDILTAAISAILSHIGVKHERD